MAGNHADKLGVPFIERAVERAAAPQDLGRHASVDGSEGRSQRPQRQGVEMAALDSGDRGLPDARNPREVRLAEATAQAQGPERCADPLIVHGARMTSGASPAIYRRSPRDLPAVAGRAVREPATNWL
jgi:hypothetical protein